LFLRFIKFLHFLHKFCYWRKFLDVLLCNIRLRVKVAARERVLNYLINFFLFKVITVLSRVFSLVIKVKHVDFLSVEERVNVLYSWFLKVSFL